MWRIIRISAGSCLCAVGILGCIYSIRTALAQKIYYSVEYGSLTNATSDVIMDACATAYEFYPHNCNLSSRATRTIWPLVAIAETDQKNSIIDQVELWCDRGLADNPYDLQLRYKKAELLSRSSASAAAEYWEEFVDWQFWNSQNLAFLVKFYANAGQFVEAAEILTLLKGHSGHKKASVFLRKAWATEMSL